MQYLTIIGLLTLLTFKVHNLIQLNEQKNVYCHLSLMIV